MSLSSSITGSGRIDINDITANWYGGLNQSSGLFIGHLSSDAATKSFIGLKIDDHDGVSFDASAYIEGPSGRMASSAPVNLPNAGMYSFTYTYDPTIDAPNNRYGRLTAVIDSVYTLTFDLSQSDRNCGAQFNSFGMGATSDLNSTNDPSATVSAYIDNVSYTGHTGTVDFETNPNWTSSNATTGGNNYGYRQVDYTDNGFYECESGEEGPELRKLNQDGSPRMVC